MTDNYVQIPPNSSGLKIDTSEVTVSGNTVERQRIVIADPTTADNLVSVGTDGALAVANDSADGLQYLMLLELRRIGLLLELISGQSVAAAELED